MADKQSRLELANKAIVIIASHGRRFFSTRAEGRTDGVERIGRFEFHGKNLFFIDKYTKKAVYVAYRKGSWRGFSDGGTLRDLVCAMADWINGDKEDFPVNRLGPWPEWVCGGDLWGYGASMANVRDEIKKLLEPTPAPPATTNTDDRVGTQDQVTTEQETSKP